MKRLIRFFELWLDVSCPVCMCAMGYLKEFAAADEDAKPVRFTLTASKKPGTGGRVHEYHLEIGHGGHDGDER